MGFTLVSERNATGAAVKDAMLTRAIASDETAGYAALRFAGSTHGSPLTLGGRICGWPSAAYPDSAESESAILEDVRSTMKAKSETASPVAAIVIEPTQHQTGYTASASFMQALRSIANDFEAALVIDETSTCCGATGSFWQHDSSAKPDYVTFGKRMQATGFFSKVEGATVGGSENDVKLFGLINSAIE